jgi:serine phosphatase RsbU (regulator of sigma subunit)/anti-sigma regulatory factor (Ser/Thr protein kinase)
VHPDDARIARSAIDEALQGPDPYRAEYRIVRPDGEVRWLAARGIVNRDEAGRPVRVVGVASDLTERRAAEEERQRLLVREQRARRAAEAATARLAFLASASAALASTLDYTQTLANVASVAVPTFADWCTFDLRRDDGTLECVAVHHQDPAKLDLARELLRKYPPDPNLAGGAYEALRTQRPQLVVEVTEEMLRRSARDERHLELLRQLQLSSVMIVPLLARHRPLGVLTLAGAESGRRYTEDDLALAAELGRRAALFLDNARLYERERRIATTLQEAFLPAALPQVPGFKLDAVLVTGSHEASLGGDWYDAFRLPDGRIGLSIGDVMGRGLRAAGAMVLVRQTIRAAAHGHEDVTQILTRANRLLRESDAEDTATALVAILDPVRSTLTYASAGHPAPLVATPDGAVASGAVGGPPLGLGGLDQAYAEHQLALPPGALAVLYTDGLTEHARDPVEGEAQLAASLRAQRGQEAADPADAIRRRVLGTSTAHDDVVVLTVAVGSTPLTRLDISLPAIPSSLPLIRQALRRFLTACGVESDRAAAMLVAVGEAANNAIEHAYGMLSGAIDIRARSADEEITVEVTDHGAWRRARADGGGRGLQIMRGMVDHVDVMPSAEGTTVRLVLRGRPAAELSTP